MLATKGAIASKMMRALPQDHPIPPLDDLPSYKAAWRELYALSMGLLFVVGISNSLYLVGGMSILQQLVPDSLRGRVMGMYAMTWSLAPLGMAQAGFVAQYFGASAAVAAGAVIIIVVAGLIWLKGPEIRDIRGTIPESQRLSHQSTPA